MREAVRSVLEQDQDRPVQEQRGGTPLITTLAMVEGDVLNYLDRYGAATLRELTRVLEWSSRLITMAIGGLVRERLARAKQFDLEIVVEPMSALPSTRNVEENILGG